MVVFADRVPLPPIVSDHRQATAETRELEGLVVPVFVVQFEVDQPSRAASNARRRNEMDDEKALLLLASIDRRLALLTGSYERDLRQALVEGILRTPARTAMFDGIDERRGSPELAKLANVSERSAQLFIKDLMDIGIVRPSPTGGRGLIVQRDEDAILQWYLRRSPANT